MGRIAAIFSCLTFLLATACGSGESSAEVAARRDLQLQADKYAISQIEETWHRATTLKDLDMMMSLWAPNGIFHVGSQTYSGKEVRVFFATKASPFKEGNNWISDHPAYKMEITVEGDDANLYFECHFVDVATRTVEAVVAADLRLERIDGTWLIINAVSATPTLSA